MKKLFGYFVIFLLTQKEAYSMCSIEGALKPASSEPSYISVIGALLLVVLLIYLTGIIYTKLNVLGSKVAKHSRKNYEKDKIFILSTTPLGNNKTLHVVEVNGEKLLIGVSQNGMEVLKELKSSSPRYEQIETESSDEQADDSPLKEIYPTETEEQNNSTDDDDDFGLYKKYL